MITITLSDSEAARLAYNLEFGQKLAIDKSNMYINTELCMGIAKEISKLTDRTMEYPELESPLKWGEPSFKVEKI